jgi:hypothetical protein
LPHDEVSSGVDFSRERIEELIAQGAHETAQQLADHDDLLEKLKRAKKEAKEEAETDARKTDAGASIRFGGQVDGVG